MSEVTLYQALQVAESNLKIGYAPRVAVEKAAEALQVSTAALALALLAKAVACGRAREQRLLIEAHDRLVQAGAARALTPYEHQVVGLRGAKKRRSASSAVAPGE
jgi:hypothetical protein